MPLDVKAVFEWLAEENFQPELVEEDTEITVCCPLCGDDRPRLYVSTESGQFICFHCHEEGNFHQFLMRVGDMSGSKAMSLKSEFTTTDPQDWFDAPPKLVTPKNDAILRLPPSFKLIDHNTPDEYLRYLEYRGVSVELAMAKGIGYATSGKYAWRIIVPVRNDGKLYTFIARTILAQCPNCREAINDCVCQPRKFPKVLTPETKEGAVPRLTLYNLDAVLKSKSPRVVVVEGVFDALRLPNEAVAVMGSSASRTQITLLTGLLRGRTCVLALDPDTAGYLGTVKVADALTAELIQVSVATLPEGEDVGSLDSAELARYLNQARRYVL